MTRVFDSEVSEDRFSRQRLISWWDQEKIAKCRLLVVGAGALGNEILKNAALLGFTQVVVVDLDRIEGRTSHGQSFIVPKMWGGSRPTRPPVPTGRSHRMQGCIL